MDLIFYFHGRTPGTVQYGLSARSTVRSLYDRNANLTTSVDKDRMRRERDMTCSASCTRIVLDEEGRASFATGMATAILRQSSIDVDACDAVQTTDLNRIVCVSLLRRRCVTKV